MSVICVFYWFVLTQLLCVVSYLCVLLVLLKNYYAFSSLCVLLGFVEKALMVFQLSMCSYVFQLSMCSIVFC